MKSGIQGFAIIQLLTVIIVIGLLLSQALPMGGRSRKSVAESIVASDLRNMVIHQEPHCTTSVQNAGERIGELEAEGRDWLSTERESLSETTVGMIAAEMRTLRAGTSQDAASFPDTAR